MEYSNNYHAKRARARYKKDSANRERIKARSNAVSPEKKKQYRETQRIKMLSARLTALGALGGKCSVPGCEWTDPRVLEIHHVEGDGADERKNYGKLWTERVLQHPERYQVLCANHHKIEHRPER